jgi:ABC-type ATPase with predicted acetyltransferase domain
MEPQRHEGGYSKPTVGAYVRVDDDCPISHRLVDNTETEFTCGFGQDVFEFVFTEEALREFVRQGTEALNDMDARLPREPGVHTG